ncbi:MAG: QueT transporter family protein [Clostridia bacterium]|nr:QueT transporter family protein [Clostridia bacterium]
MTRRITMSAMCIALYCVVMYFTQAFAFGAYQIRIATAIYSLGFFFPWLTIPMGFANALSNMLMGGFGVFDILGGALAGVLTTGSCALLGRLRTGWAPYTVAFPVTLIPALLVPIWLAPALGMPYWPLAVNLLVGQFFPGVVSAVLITVMKKYHIKERFSL